jgi:hypothetical protein
MTTPREKVIQQLKELGTKAIPPIEFVFGERQDACAAKFSEASL